MEAFYNMQEEHSTLDFKWVGVRTVTPGEKWSDTQPMHLIGFNPNRNDEPSSNARPNPGKYPLFYLMDAEKHSDFRQLDYPNRMIESYKVHFESRLRYLRNREEYVSLSFKGEKTPSSSASALGG
jgi:hypothetical protein